MAAAKDMTTANLSPQLTTPRHLLLSKITTKNPRSPPQQVVLVPYTHHHFRIADFLQSTTTTITHNYIALIAHFLLVLPTKALHRRQRHTLAILDY